MKVILFPYSELTNPPNASDKYEKLGKLGEGSYGKVFKCRNKKTGEIVAIKRYHQVDDFEIIQKTALREIKILKMLNHPHIIKIVEVFRRSRKIHIVFEYCEFTLLTELNDYPRGFVTFFFQHLNVVVYPQSDTVRLMYQIVDAIRYLHSEQIIYRDPKPENILLTKDRVVKLCDFGFARTVDIWGIGCIMIEVLTGEPLWTGKTDLDHLYQIRGTFETLLYNCTYCRILIHIQNTVRYEVSLRLLVKLCV
ncbi:Cyclin-dependent kinase-like 1 [Armadillidium nasatum]|uniref:cyclin-dependent kinase n=1 Tax=Armadillidium nasatum TaxID=96803 RepID=A0A5N5SP81_9CRUS|nr:Cyclin-dependent kinase-like 1 [Armadillidium nasatum]